MTTNRFRATIEYDGTNYQGFQRQRSEDPTIQGALEATLTGIAGEPVTVVGSGRTDTGVHALGQVVAFSLAWTHGSDALLRAMNAGLPADIAVRSLVPAGAAFHPRYDALRRRYQYRVWNDPVRSPTRTRYAWHVSRPLNVDAMNDAAGGLVGIHDFATFGRPPQGTNTVRDVSVARWQRHGDVLEFDVEANAFLYRMVRSLVGCLVLVGMERWSTAAFMEALTALDRGCVTLLAPPCGLFLMSVTYE